MWNFLFKSAIRFKRSCIHKISIWYIVKKSTKAIILLNLVAAKIPFLTSFYTLRLFIPGSLSKICHRFKRICVHKISIWYLVKKLTKGHNSVKFGRSKNSFLYCYHQHILCVHPWKYKQHLPSGLRGVAFTKFLHSI
jgi:hypothetical protein